MKFTVTVTTNLKKYEFDLKSDSGEPIDHFKERVRFIIAQGVYQQKLLDPIITYSHVYVNTQFKQCVYSPEVTQILQPMIKKLENCQIARSINF